MTHKYQITGMTCGSCESKVKSALLSQHGITKVELSKTDNSATITMDKHIQLSELQKVLDSKYQISNAQDNEIIEKTESWFTIYKPVLLILYTYSILST